MVAVIVFTWEACAIPCALQAAFLLYAQYQRRCAAPSCMLLLGGGTDALSVMLVTQSALRHVPEQLDTKTALVHLAASAFRSALITSITYSFLTSASRKWASGPGSS